MRAAGELASGLQSVNAKVDGVAEAVAVIQRMLVAQAAREQARVQACERGGGDGVDVSSYVESDASMEPRRARPSTAARRNPLVPLE